MKTNTKLLGKRSLLSFITIVAVTAGYAHTSRAEPDDKIIIGETAEIAGGTAATWARVNGAGKVIWVGLTIPLSMAENMPPRGTGPAGAIAVLNFPAVVQATTYFNHAEIHSQQHGHPAGGEDPHRYEAPHAKLRADPDLFGAGVEVERRLLLNLGLGVAGRDHFHANLRRSRKTDAAAELVHERG